MRNDCLERRLGLWVTAFSSTIYVLASAYAVYLIFTFYSRLYGGMLGR